MRYHVFLKMRVRGITDTIKKPLDFVFKGKLDELSLVKVKQTHGVNKSEVASSSSAAAV